ncbi:MAG: hypothetical protein K6F56_04550 [Oscillospiraceae bacterium]|nr:hypothetical protein [Oscillospiraceae bacterium]
MDYPLLIGGEHAGTLTESKSGLYTVFEARLPKDPGGLVRLYVHGGGESAYLGLMEPQNGGLFLRRSLSGLERRTLPTVIDCASDSPEAVGEEAPTSLHNTESPPQTTLSACPWPAPVPEGDGDLLWLRCTDGTLRAHDGVSTLVAFPARLKSPAPRAVLRRIGDTDYMVFRR